MKYYCRCLRMNFQMDILQRRAVDHNGLLGSFYDIVSDRIAGLTQQDLTPNLKLVERSTCTIFHGEQSADLVDYLKKMNYDDGIRQSLVFGVIQPCGVSSFLTYDQEINEYTRFLYYSYTSRVVESNSTSGAKGSVLSNTYQSNVTYRIVGVEYGFELLYVMQIRDRQSCKQVDTLLDMAKQDLEATGKNFKFVNEQMKQIYQIVDVTTYTSKYGVRKMPTDDVFTEIEAYIRETRSHIPLIYQLKVMNRETNSSAIVTNMTTPDMISSIGKLESFMKEINISKRKLKQIVTKCSQEDCKTVLKKQWEQLFHDYQKLINTYDTFFEESKQTVLKLRRGPCKSNEIDRILSNVHYKDLKTKLDTLHQAMENHLFKKALVLTLRKYDIQYKDISEFPPFAWEQPTFQNIHDAVKNHIAKVYEYVVLFYSTDQLIHKNQMTWEGSLSNLATATKAKNKTGKLFYVDLTRYKEVLLDFQIRTLPEEQRECNYLLKTF